MKFLAAMMVFMMLAQPAQAGVCAMMQPGGQADMNRADMHHAGMHHADMHHKGDGGTAGHDCCAPDDGDRNSNCDNMAQCGSCTAGLAMIATMHGQAAAPIAPQHVLLSDGCIAPSHSVPPFRPPTDIS